MGGSLPPSRSQSPSRHADLPEDRQVEHSSADLVDVVAWICSICNLLPAPSESCKIGDFRADLDSED